MTRPNHESERELEELRRSTLAPVHNVMRWLILLFLLFIVPLIAFGWWVEWQSEREVEASELLRDQLRARALGSVARKELDTAERILLSVSGRKLFREGWAKRDLPGLERHFQDVLQLEPDFLFVSTYETDGTMRAMLPPGSLIGQNFAHRDWYRGVTGRQQPYVSEVYRTAVAPYPLVVGIAVPILDEQAKPAGILMAAYPLDKLSRQFAMLQAGERGEPYVVDQRGIVAASPNVSPRADPVRAPDAAAANRALAGEEGAERFSGDGGEFFIGYAPIEKLGWGVVYRRPAAEALKSVQQLRRRGLTASFYLLAIYLGTAFIASYLVRGQGRLLAANRALNKGLADRVEELKQAHQAVTRSEQEVRSQSLILRSVLDNMGDGVVVADANGHFIVYNAAAERIVGMGSFNGKPEEWSEHFGIFLPDTVTPFPPQDLPMTRALRGEAVEGAELFIRHAARPEGIWINVNARPLRREDGRVDGGVAVFREVTAQKQAESALRQAKEEAERVSRFKDQFLSTMSHELRTPLNAVLGFSELLQDERYGPMNERQRRYLEHIQAGGKHLLTLINEILDLSKIEAGRLELTLTTVSVSKAFETVLNILRPLADKKAQELSADVDARIGVRADAMRFQQVLTNLVGNAIKFTPAGGHIRLAARLENGRARIEIHDNGPGISLEDQQRIFDAFYRVRKAGDSPEGSGLGLAITKRLVELQGGELKVTSKAGRGSCFYFSLHAVERPSESAAPAVRSAGPLVLVVEDDVVAAQLIRSQLASAGYAVEICQEPQRAVELAVKLRPRVITLDILMEPVNGFEVLLHLKNDSRTAPIPVIVVTVVEQAQMGLTLGATEYLIKPVEKQSLLDAVRRCLGAGRTELQRPILIVEDDPLTREAISDMLASSGYAVAALGDGEAARQWVSYTVPELVILDLMLPNVSGFELLAEWRSAARTSNIPVFVLTAKDLSKEEERYLRDRAEILLQKQQPWQQALLDQIRRVITNGPPAGPS